MRFFSTLLSPFTRLFSGPARFLGLPKRLLGLSLPARVAWVLGLFLVLCVVGYLSFVVYREGSSGLWDRFHHYFALPIVLLLFGLPTAAYWTTRFWIEVESSQFPDIDAAWAAGYEALAKAGIDLGTTPLYIAIGVHDANSAATLMNASGWELLVDGKPDGAAPLRWYASRDAVILFCLDACGLSLCHAPQREGSATSGGHRSPGASNIRQTLMPGSGGAAEDERESRRLGIRGTMLSDAPLESDRGAAPSRTSVGIRGTMIAGTGDAMQAADSTEAQGAVRTVDRVEMSQQEERLARVCKLARQSRQPYCAINGVLAFVNWKLISSQQSNSLAMSIRQDTMTIVEHCGMHAPLLVVVSGMEQEIGFSELVRRVGEERAQGNRFGQGFNHQASPSQQQMIALASNAAGAFEGWVYDLFRQPDCLSRSNNDKLFAMLCRIRSIVQPQLTDLFVGFSETVSLEQPRSLFLGGCYFAATGGGKTRQAFVRSILSKMVEMQEELQWTDKSLREEFRYRSLVQALTVWNGLMVVFILSVVIWKIMSH